MRLSTPDRFGVGTLHALSVSAANNATKVCLIDLAATRVFDPVGLVAIAALADRERRMGRSLSIIPPSDPKACREVQDFGLLTLLDRISASTPMPFGAESVPSQGTAIAAIRGESDAEELSKLVYEAVVARHGRHGAAGLQQSVFELGANISDHAGVAHGYMIVSSYSGGVTVAVADSGVGIRRWLPAADDVGAIQRALQEGVSRIKVPGRGRGLPRVMQVVSRTGGYASVVSGRGEVTVGFAPPSSKLLGRDMPGTYIQATVGC